MTSADPSYVTAAISCGDPADIDVDFVNDMTKRPYRVMFRADNGLKSSLHLSAFAAEMLVDGLIEALTAGGDRHDPAPF